MHLIFNIQFIKYCEKIVILVLIKKIMTASCRRVGYISRAVFSAQSDMLVYNTGVWGPLVLGSYELSHSAFERSQTSSASRACWRKFTSTLLASVYRRPLWGFVYALFLPLHIVVPAVPSHLHDVERHVECLFVSISLQESAF